VVIKRHHTKLFSAEFQPYRSDNTENRCTPWYDHK